MAMKISKQSDIVIEEKTSAADGNKISIPASLKLIREVEVPVQCGNVCCHRGTTYVLPRDGEMYTLEDLGQCVKAVSGTKFSKVTGMTAYNNRLYILCLGRPWKVVVADTAGTILATWAHHDISSGDNQLTVVGDHIVIPKRSSEELIVYSLEGKIVKSVPKLHQLKGEEISICTVYDNSVVVAAYESSTVFRVNINTGHVIWSCAVDKPCHVVCYMREYILVLHVNNNITVLEADTGNTSSIRAYLHKVYHI